MVTLSPMLRRMLLILATGLMAALGWLGIVGAISERGEAGTPGQIAQVICQFLYGALSLAAIWAALRHPAWLHRLVVAWLVALTLAAILASIVWGGTSFGIGLLAGAAAFVVGALIAWLLGIGAEGIGA